MQHYIEYLRDPVLVSRIQKYFGVKVDQSQANGTARGEGNLTVDRPKGRSYEITNRFWYYLFLFGTALGDEVFYASFIPFWFWNIDGAVGRRVVMVWSVVMYIGQGIKDIIRWPRPGPPVVQLQNKWSLEYGMPSTHAMVAVSIPFSVVLYTMNRYQYNVWLGFAIATVWCILVCSSRLYLGMHNVLDIVVGLVLAVVLLFPLVPLADRLDNYLISSPLTPLALLVTSIPMIVYYPHGDKWTPTRGDTTMVVSVCVCIYLGAWLNFQLGQKTPSDLTRPYTVLWPSFYMIGLMLLRTMLGFAFILLTRAVAKKVSYNVLCALLGHNANDLRRSENALKNKHKTFVDLCCTFITYGLIGFDTSFLMPIIFRLLKIERPTFYTEI